MALRRSGVRSPSAPPTRSQGISAEHAEDGIGNLAASDPDREFNRSAAHLFRFLAAGGLSAALRMQWSNPTQSTR
jgi:hypothetical protein